MKRSWSFTIYEEDLWLKKRRLTGENLFIQNPKSKIKKLINHD